MSKQLKILLVTNSVPLPATDFLKYKLFGLSKVFDVHLLCWDSNENRQAFCDKYSDKIENRNIHLFYSKMNATTFMKIVLLNICRALLFPHIGIPLKFKLIKTYGWDVKKLFIKFHLYFPLIKLKPDVIHFEYGTLAHSFSDIKDYANCKISTSFRGYDINYVGLEDEHYYNKVWNNFDGFHFLGKDLKNRAVNRGYIEGKAEALIPPAIDTDYFAPETLEKKRDKLVITSVGRLAWKKGYEYGLQAVAKLKEKGIPFEYRIIAEGVYKQPILFAIRELGLQNEVSIVSVSEHQQVKAELSKAHVFLHPAISEGFSNAVLEAQAMGLPVITTNADGLSENIVDGITGFVVPVYDANAMAEKLEWCYRNRDKSVEMGKAGTERVQKYFRIEDQVKKFEAFYRKLYEQ